MYEDFKTKSDFPGKRLFEVFHMIGKFGPVTLTQLMAHSDLTRSTLHRYCMQLEAIGMVRKRPADKAYQLSFAADETFSQANYTPHEVQELHPILAAYKQKKAFHLTVSGFTERGRFQDLEGTQPPTQWQSRLSLAFDIQAHVALAGLSRKEQILHILRFMKTAEPDEQQMIDSGALNRALTSLDITTPTAHPNQPSMSIPWRSSIGTSMVLTLTAQSDNHVTELSTQMHALMKEPTLRLTKQVQTSKLHFPK